MLKRIVCLCLVLGMVCLFSGCQSNSACCGDGQAACCEKGPDGKCTADCKAACCKKCPEGCTKPCCAKAKACPPGCTKPCCKKS